MQYSQIPQLIEPLFKEQAKQVGEFEMAHKSNKTKHNFLYPLRSYHGEFTPINLAFNSNLQEFSQQVSYICNLESNGKIAPEETYREIKQLWKQLKRSKKELLDNTKFTLDK